MRTNTNQKGKTNKRMIVMLATTLIIGLQNIYAQTELYKKYQHRKDITVACAMQFPINNDVKTNITIFVPKTKEELWNMLQEFNVDVEKDTVYSRLEKGKRYPLYSYNVHKDDIKKKYKSVTSDEDYKKIVELVYNYNAGTILIIHDIETKERYLAIERYLVRSLKNPEILSIGNNKYTTNE